MAKDVEEKKERPRGSGNGGSSGKDKTTPTRRLQSDGSGNEKMNHSGDRHRSRRTTRKGLRIFVGTANLSQTIPGK